MKDKPDIWDSEAGCFFFVAIALFIAVIFLPILAPDSRHRFRP